MRPGAFSNEEVTYGSLLEKAPGAKMSMRRILVSTSKKKRNVLSPGVVREIAIAADKEGGGPMTVVFQSAL
jgi:hypothetical protein